MVVPRVMLSVKWRVTIWWFEWNIAGHLAYPDSFTILAISYFIDAQKLIFDCHRGTRYSYAGVKSESPQFEVNYSNWLSERRGNKTIVISLIVWMNDWLTDLKLNIGLNHTIGVGLKKRIFPSWCVGFSLALSGETEIETSWHGTDLSPELVNNNSPTQCPGC